MAKIWISECRIQVFDMSQPKVNDAKKVKIDNTLLLRIEAALDEFYEVQQILSDLYYEDELDDD